MSLRDDDQPRNHWPMGRIAEVQRSGDGLVRTVVVKVASPGGNGPPKLRIRPISKVVLLIPHKDHECQQGPIPSNKSAGGGNVIASSDLVNDTGHTDN